MIIIGEIEEPDQGRIHAKNGRNRTHEIIVADIELGQLPCSLKELRLDYLAKVIARYVNNLNGGWPTRYISKYMVVAQIKDFELIQGRKQSFRKGTRK